MASTLSQLLVAQTQAQVQQLLLAFLQNPNGALTTITGQTVTGYQPLPVTDWEPGGVERTNVAMDSYAYADLISNTLPAIASGGFVQLAMGAQSGWLSLVGQFYNLTANAALSTTGYAYLTVAAGNGPYTLSTASPLWIKSTTGNLYYTTSAPTIYAPGYSSTTHTGTGSATVVGTGTPTTGGYTITITIVAGGGLGAATYYYTIAATGISGVVYQNGSSAAPITTPTGATPQNSTESFTGSTIKWDTTGGNFVAGDTYSFDVRGALWVPVQSQFANNSALGLNYVDGSNTLTTLVTPLTGMTVNNQGPFKDANSVYSTGPDDFTTPVLSGTSTGTVTPNRHAAGTPPINANNYVLTIQVAGQVGVAKFDLSVNGTSYTNSEAHWTTAATFTVDATIAGGISTGMDILFGNGTSPSFNAGDVYTWSTPGAWITQQGTDVESDPAFRTRCIGRWPSLSSVPTLQAYVTMALNASSQVTRAYAVTDGTINNKIKIYIGGQAGTVPASVKQTVKTYINARVPASDYPNVLDIVTASVVLAGTATVKASAKAACQAAAQTAVQGYISALPVGDGSTVYVRIADLITAIMTGTYPGGPASNPTLVANMVNLTGLTINLAGGGASSSDQLVAIGNMATYSNAITTDLTWNTQ